MANFTPNGTIKIGRVPFDNSYQHTMTFASAAAQQEYFSSVCTRNLDKSSYTYIRPDNAVRVPFNAEDLYTYNYVMFQNANYGQKWFYAFIVDCTYVNENTTQLLLELDVMQTWYFDYKFSYCMVEREHTADDPVGKYTNPEPEMPFNITTYAEAKWDPYRDGAYAVMLTTVTSNDGSTLKEVDGCDMNGIFSGGKLIAEEVQDGGRPEILPNYMSMIQKAGGAEGVISIFMYPARLAIGLTPITGAVGIPTGLYTLNRAKGGVNDLHYITQPDTLRGYVPRNNKLFSYPYSFCRIETTTGETSDLKWEYWEKNTDGFRVLNVSSALAPDAMAIMQPQRYAGSANIYSPSQAISLKVALPCAWVNSAYQTWAAQNAFSNMISIGLNAAMLAFPAARGVGVAAKALTGTARATKSLRAKGLLDKYSSGTIAAGQKSLRQQAVKKGVDAATAPAALAAAGAGAMGLTSIAGNYDRMQHTPATMRGTVDGNTLFAQNQLYFKIAAMGITPEYAHIVDEFFDMFGYQIDRVKIPNITSRPYWNYIKTANACHRGNVPADDMATINAIYDAGITFWHTPQVGNYSLDNTLQ